MKKPISIVLALGMLVGLATAASATVTFTGVSGSLAASASFTVTGTTVTLVLTNTSLADVANPAQVLTGVFFDITGFPPNTLTPTSAALTAGSSVFYGSTDPGNVVGGEWAYGSALAGAPGGAYLGTSSSGLGLFGGSNFPGNNLQGPAAVDGVQYGITSAGDNLALGNAAVTGSNALIRNSVTFTLVAGSTFSESSIHNVSFQYGTSLGEPNVPGVPEPGTLLALGTGLVALGAARAKNRKK